MAAYCDGCRYRVTCAPDWTAAQLKQALWAGGIARANKGEGEGEGAAPGMQRWQDIVSFSLVGVGGLGRRGSRASARTHPLSVATTNPTTQHTKTNTPKSSNRRCCTRCSAWPTTCRSRTTTCRRCAMVLLCAVCCCGVLCCAACCAATTHDPAREHNLLSDHHHTHTRAPKKQTGLQGAGRDRARQAGERRARRRVGVLELREEKRER